MTTSNATLAGAIKTVLEQAGLGLSVYRMVAPPKAHLPFCVVLENVSWLPLPHGDTDVNPELTIRAQAQVDIYQELRAVDGTRTEDPDLEDEICLILHNTRLPTWVNHVNGVRILTRSAGLGETEPNVRRTIVTLEIDWSFESRAASVRRRL